MSSQLDYFFQRDAVEFDYPSIYTDETKTQTIDLSGATVTGIVLRLGLAKQGVSTVEAVGVVQGAGLRYTLPSVDSEGVPAGIYDIQAEATINGSRATISPPGAQVQCYAALPDIP